MAECRRCHTSVNAEVLACPNCHALIYEDELERLKAEAVQLEADGRYSLSREVWRQALARVPARTKQATWIVGHLAELEQLTDATPETEATAASRPTWLRWLGPIAPIILLLLKGKGLFALVFNGKFLFSLFAFVGFYGSQFGFVFGAGFAALILVHELGHYVDIRRRGLPADMPIFLPGLGAYVRWRALGVSDVTRAEVSLAGPLAGGLAAIACALIWAAGGSPVWAALARASAWLNVLNLIPVWALDGGQAVAVLGRSGRVLLLTASVLLWLLLGESVFVLVAGGAVFQLFTNAPPEGSGQRIAVYFVALLIGLGAVMRLMPGEGAGIP